MSDENKPEKYESPAKLLSNAALVLSEICDVVDDEANEGHDITPQLQAAFNASTLAVQGGVDKAFEFEGLLKSEIERSRQLRAYFDNRKHTLEAALDAFKTEVKNVLAEHPDQPYSGSYGRIAIQANPPAVKVTFEDRKLTPHVIEFFGIDEKYVKTEVTYALNGKLVGDDLKAGVQLPWASLERGTHVRFRKG